MKRLDNLNLTKECDCMKKLIALLLATVWLLSLVACGNRLVEGSEKTYYGTVTDRAMSVVNEGERQSRAYIWHAKWMDAAAMAQRRRTMATAIRRRRQRM